MPSRCRMWEAQAEHNIHALHDQQDSLVVWVPLVVGGAAAPFVTAAAAPIATIELLRGLALGLLR